MELKATVTAKGAIFEGKAPEIIQTALTSAMYEATQSLEKKVKAKTPVGVGGAKGGLLSTIYGEVERGIPVIKGIVATQSPYGEVIEKGRTAGKKWPPEGVLIRWIELKMGVDEATAQRLEFVIRRKIGKKGFPGAHMFERAFTESWPQIKGIFERAGFNIARELNE